MYRPAAIGAASAPHERRSASSAHGHPARSYDGSRELLVAAPGAYGSRSMGKLSRAVDRARNARGPLHNAQRAIAAPDENPRGAYLFRRDG